MQWFEYKDYEVVINPALFTFKPFKAIKDKYRGKEKYLATQEISYIWHFASWDSDYSDITDDKERSEKILSELFVKDGHKIKVDEKTKEAIDFFLEHQDTMAIKLHRDAKAAINKLRDYFKKVDLLEVDANGKSVHDVTKLTNAINAVSTLVNKMDELEEKIRNQQEKAGRIKGKVDLGFFED
jgi:hypothetical protein